MTYKIKLDKFEGPLDLLLDLIEQKKLSINEITLSKVTQEYFNYLKTLEEKIIEKKVAYEELSAFLVIASTLILIKSKSLLPGFKLTKEEEEDVSNLKERLEEYKKIREFSKQIDNLLINKKRLFTKEPFMGLEGHFIPPPPIPLIELPKIIRELLQALPPKEILPEKKVKEVISIEKKISELENRIQKNVVKSFSEVVGRKEKTEVIVSFLALLELIKLGIIAARQEKTFSNIDLKRISI